MAWTRREARKLFKTESGDYQKTCDFVVPSSFEPQAIKDGGATTDSHFDEISKATTNAFAEWCKHQPVGTMEILLTKVFKLF